jgi:hypothetical protein
MSKSLDPDCTVYEIQDRGWKKFGSGMNIPNPQHCPTAGFHYRTFTPAAPTALLVPVKQEFNPGEHRVEVVGVVTATVVVVVVVVVGIGEDLLHLIVQFLAVAEHLLLVVVVQRVRVLVSKQSFNQTKCKSMKMSRADPYRDFVTILGGALMQYVASEVKISETSVPLPQIKI